MIAAIDRYKEVFQQRGAECFCPEFEQELPEEKLLELVPQFDGWIIGDDPANEAVLSAGTQGKLRAAVRWGIGVNNVDFEAAMRLGLDIRNTPGMFNEEVSDVAVGYAIGLVRHLFEIDRGVRAGRWPKPPGRSSSVLKAGVVGYGNIGRSTCRKLKSLGWSVAFSDPFFDGQPDDGLARKSWPELMDDIDLLVLTCALTPENHHMINGRTLSRAGRGLRIVNVARGPLIDEAALADALTEGQVGCAALDVLEIEPLPLESKLRTFEQVVFGSHNGSNTCDAVDRASRRAIELLFERLETLERTA